MYDYYYVEERGSSLLRLQNQYSFDIEEPIKAGETTVHLMAVLHYLGLNTPLN